MSAIQSPYSAGLTKVAATPVAGVALVNGTPSILTWTAPNDGQLHRFTIFANLDVTVTEVGGIIGVAFTMPDGVSGYTFHLSAGSQGVGYDYSLFMAIPLLIAAGSTVAITQASALTSGAATFWAEIWGS